MHGLIRVPAHATIDLFPIYRACETACGQQASSGDDKPIGVHKRRLCIARCRAFCLLCNPQFPIARSLPFGVGRNVNAYRHFGCDLVPDAEPDQGSLGGLVSCFAGIPVEWLLSCPGDAPWTAPNLVEALSKDARAHGVAVAHDGKRRQNLTLLIGREKAESLARFYVDGGRAVFRWIEANAIPATDLSEIASSFVNINTPADLEAFRLCADSATPLRFAQNDNE